RDTRRPIARAKRDREAPLSLAPGALLRPRLAGRGADLSRKAGSHHRGVRAGGPADVMARLIGQRLTTTLAQSFVIDNRPGAGGTMGARAAAEADPDGYTLLLGNTSTLVLGPLTYRNVGYDPAKSFAPIAMLGTTSNFLIVHPGFAPKSVAELIALAKAQPAKFNYASPGSGTSPHLIG